MLNKTFDTQNYADLDPNHQVLMQVSKESEDKEEEVHVIQLEPVFNEADFDTKLLKVQEALIEFLKEDE